MVLSDCCQVEPGWGKWWLICCLPSSPSPQAEQPSTTRELNLGNFHLHDCITNLTITCSLQKLIYIWRRVLYQSRYTRINNWIGLMKKCLLVINGLIQSSQKHLFTIFISHDISRLNHAPPQGESTAMLRLGLGLAKNRQPTVDRMRCTFLQMGRTSRQQSTTAGVLVSRRNRGI